MCSDPQNPATDDMVRAETEICKCLGAISPEQALMRLYDFTSDDFRYALFLALMMRVTTADKIAKAKARRNNEVRP